MYVCLSTPLGFILRTHWVAFQTTLDLHVHIPELGVFGEIPVTDQSGVVEAWRLDSKSS